MAEVGRQLWTLSSLLPCSNRVHYSRLPRTVSSQVLNVSKDGDCAISEQPDPVLNHLHSKKGVGWGVLLSFPSSPLPPPLHLSSVPHVSVCAIASCPVSGLSWEESGCAFYLPFQVFIHTHLIPEVFFSWGWTVQLFQSLHISQVFWTLNCLCGLLLDLGDPGTQHKTPDVALAVLSKPAFQPVGPRPVCWVIPPLPGAGCCISLHGILWYFQLAHFSSLHTSSSSVIWIWK